MPPYLRRREFRALTGELLEVWALTDHGYRQWTRAIIFAISIVYLVRAAWLFWRTHGG